MIRSSTQSLVMVLIMNEIQTEVSPKLCSDFSPDHPQQCVHKRFSGELLFLTANGIKIIAQCDLGNYMSQI